jgi:hypothetical protein
MSLPGFGAQSSLYKTIGNYWMAGSFDHAQGIIPQSITCGACFWQNNACVRECTVCIFHKCPPGTINSCDPGGCTTTTQACPSTEHCPPKPPCCPAGCQGTC